ncbi:hypothetical protein ASZ90_017741 [hydrocarbon metagenome]|uniref:Response regulatory domain-containing protein n=1 Tax=hydrocarbon metagenome TaxID=938273 RepID=A0A0W8E8S2_9ZZZZ
MRAILIQDRYSRGNRLIQMLKKIPEIEIVMQSDKANDAAQICAEHRPDLLILNTFSKDRKALEYTGHIKQNFPDIKILVIIGAEDNDLAREASEAGADIVVRKIFSLDELKQFIRYSQKHYRVFPNTGPEPQDPTQKIIPKVIRKE